MVRYDKLVAASLIVLILATGCASAGPTTPTAEPETGMPTVVSSAADLAPTGPVADVISIDVQGEPGRYAFSVEIESTDQGCEQYADWWEVISEEGTLIYRRILLHSHVNEQPFTRSGGPVDVAPGTTVWVRAHMNSGGYGGQAFKGSVKTGFAPAEMPAGFAEGLAEQVPLPDGCAF